MPKSGSKGRPCSGARVRSYACRAIPEALECGFSEVEPAKGLGVLAPTDLVPPHHEEGAQEYGRRAASEIMARYAPS